MGREHHIGGGNGLWCYHGYKTGQWPIHGFNTHLGPAIHLCSVVRLDNLSNEEKKLTFARNLAYQLILQLPLSGSIIPIVLPSCYLWVVDTVALRRGTWVIESGTKLNIHLWDGLEIEYELPKKHHKPRLTIE